MNTVQQSIVCAMVFALGLLSSAGFAAQLNNNKPSIDDQIVSITQILDIKTAQDAPISEDHEAEAISASPETPVIPPPPEPTRKHKKSVKKPAEKKDVAAEPIEDKAVKNRDIADKKEISDPPDFKILSGDVLQITVWKEEGLDQEVLVLPGGTITFPLVGTLPTQGKTPEELQNDIKQKLSKLIPDASVTVAVKAALGHTVSVIGQVMKPGEFVMGRRLTVMQALSQAGGLTPYASEGGIKIIRHQGDGTEMSIAFPYDDVADGAHLEKDIGLNPGDVVVVPTASLL